MGVSGSLPAPADEALGKNEKTHLTMGHLIAQQSKNGAGGNRTPVPKRPERRIYACSQRFNLNPPPATDSLLRVQSPVINLAASPPGTPGVGQPAVIEPRHSRRLAGFRLPVYQAAMRYCSSADIIVAWFLRGHHAPRRATPNLKLVRSKPHRPQFIKQAAALEPRVILCSLSTQSGRTLRARPPVLQMLF